MRRPTLKSALVGEELDPAGLVDEIENLRQGTRDQYESDWTSILGTTAITGGQVITFTHGLEEIPWIVDVMSSKESDGRKAIDDNASATVTKDDTAITVKNGAAANLYFKVRAM